MLSEGLRHALLGPELRSVPVAEFLRARAAGDLAQEAEFFANLRLRNGIFKTTRARRLDSTTPPVIGQLRAAGRSSVRVLDVGCSSGISTVELHEALAAAGLAGETFGTDLVTSAVHVARADGCGLLFDRDRRVLQVDLGAWAGSWSWPPLRRDLLYRPHKVARGRWLLGPGARPFRQALERPRPGYRVTEVPLLSSAVERAPGVCIVEEDVRAPEIPGRFDFIRAANFLNLLYFAEAEIERIARLLAERLRPGGLLLVVRTPEFEEVNHGTLFRLSDGALEPLATIGQGSDVAALVRRARPAPAAGREPDRGVAP